MEEADKGRLMTTIIVSGCMFLLVPAHSGCPGQNPESCKMAMCVCVFSYRLMISGLLLLLLFLLLSLLITARFFSFVLCFAELWKTQTILIFARRTVQDKILTLLRRYGSW